MIIITLRVWALFMLLVVWQTGYTKGWVGASGTCAPGGKGTIQFHFCDWRPNTGAYFGDGQMIGMSASEGNGSDDITYVPRSDYYSVIVYWCGRPENMDTCSKSRGTVLMIGDRVWLASSLPFSKQHIFNNSQTKKAPSAGGYCFTIADDNGYEYRGNMGYGPDGRGKFCGDVHKLPIDPPKCSINNDSNLDIQLGKLERGDIAVKSGTTTPVSKDIIINCVGNIEYNANMKLDYTPISVSNENVVSTSTNGLGVAVLYKGKAIQPGESFPLSYQPGINTLSLAFEAVRDPAMALSDLETGNFTANAVLIFTEQ